MRRTAALVLAAPLVLASCSSGPHPKAVGGAPGPAGPTSAAAPPAPCRDADLRSGYRGGGLGTGNDFGTLVLWNAGPRACRLDGQVAFTALLADGQRDPAAGVGTPQAVTFLLPPGTAAPAPGVDLTSGPYVQAFLQAPERDDPGRPDGLCRRGDELTPSRLSLSIGRSTVSTPNRDPHAIGAPSIYGCHGRITLDSVAAPGSGS